MHVQITRKVANGFRCMWKDKSMVRIAWSRTEQELLVLASCVQPTCGIVFGGRVSHNNTDKDLFLLGCSACGGCSPTPHPLYSSGKTQFFKWFLPFPAILSMTCIVCRLHWARLHVCVCERGFGGCVRPCRSLWYPTCIMPAFCTGVRTVPHTGQSERVFACDHLKFQMWEFFLVFYY